MVSPSKEFASLQIADKLTAATAHLPAPLSVVDIDAFDANARHLATRTHGKPIRIATKSVRNRTLIDRALAMPGFAGLMAYSLAEALWLVEHNYTDILVAYPSVDRHAIATLVNSEKALAEITLVVDNLDQLDILLAEAPVSPLRIALDIDSSLRILQKLPTPIHIGVRRSPLHTVADVLQFVRSVEGKGNFTIVGAMFYDAQIAGMPDHSLAVRTMKKLSRAELAQRRAEIVSALSQVLPPLEIVNAGGTGSIGDYERANEVTEVTAGSGFYFPTLFDGYRGIGLAPSAYFGLDVTRYPKPSMFTAFSGGYMASGQVALSRQPKPILPNHLLTSREGVGEVQTPVRVLDGTMPEIGSRVWFRHAKAGEQMERFNVSHLISGEEVVASVPTYRGEGRNFG